MPLSRIFKVANVSFNAIRENKILARSSEFIVGSPFCVADLIFDCVVPSVQLMAFGESGRTISSAP